MKRESGIDGGAVADETARAHQQLKALAWLLDSSIPLPGGFRIGIDAILGLVPFLGDAAGVLLSGYIVRQAARLGAPPSVLVRMMLNIAVEGLVGIVPLAGDVFDAAWKANQRNVALLGRHLENPAASTRSSRRFVGLVVLGIVLLVVLMGMVSALLMGWLLRALGG